MSKQSLYGFGIENSQGINANLPGRDMKTGRAINAAIARVRDEEQLKEIVKSNKKLTEITDILNASLKTQQSMDSRLENMVGLLSTNNTTEVKSRTKNNDPRSMPKGPVNLARTKTG